MPDFDPTACDLFINECGKSFSAQDLFRMVVGVDANGCPYVKTNGPTAQQVTDLTTAITNLTTAINNM